MTREKERQLTSAILLVMHEEELELLDVADAELEETIGHQEAGLRVRAVANLDVHGSALEVTTGASIHTVGLAPGLLCIQKRVPPMYIRHKHVVDKSNCGHGSQFTTHERQTRPLRTH